MPFVSVPDAQIHYEVFGSGEPLLLMHGGYVSAEYWKHAGYVDAWSARHTVILMDFRGHGRSSAPHDPAAYGVAKDVADALAVIDDRNLGEVTAVGWSWGGTVGLGLAALHKERIRGVLAISSSGRHGGFTDLEPDFSWAVGRPERFETEGMEWVAEAVAETGGGLSWLAGPVLENDPQAMAAWSRAHFTQGSLGCALADVRRPVTYAPGEDEVQLLRFPQPLLPANASFQPIAGANHVTAFLRLDHVTDCLTQLHRAAGQALG